MRDLWDSPALHEMQRNAEFLKFIQSIFDSPALRMARELSHFSKGHNVSSLFDSPAVRELLRVSEMHSSAVRELATAFRPTNNVSSEFERLNTAINSPAYQMLHQGAERERQVIQQMLSLSSTLRPVREFLEATREYSTAPYLGRMIEIASQLVGATDADEIEALASSLEKHFRKHASTLPPGKISVEGMLGIALTIILFLMANYASNQSEERIGVRVAQVEQNIVASVEHLLLREETGKYYVVTYQTKVMLRPRPKSPLVTWLYPKQKVKVEAEKGAWLHISFFDYEEGVTKTGWARKKYMKRILVDSEPLRTPTADTSEPSRHKGAAAADDPTDETKEIWIQFSESMRVISYSPDQEQRIAELRELLRKGTRAHLESKEDGTYEVLGPERVYYVTMTPKREFAALLSSWPLDQQPVKVILPIGA